MYIKTTVRYYLILVEWLLAKKQTITNIREDEKKKETLNTVGSNVKWYSLYGRQCVCVCVRVCVCVCELCPTLCDPMTYSLSGSSVHGILQARILEWVAIPFPQGISRDWTWVSCIAGWATSEVLFNISTTLKQHCYNLSQVITTFCQMSENSKLFEVRDMLKPSLYPEPCDCHIVEN